MIQIKRYDTIEFDEKETLRYAGCRTADSNVTSLMKDCAVQVQSLVKPVVCFTEISENEIRHLLEFSDYNSAFSKYISGCSRAVLFAASIGLEFDRFSAKCERLSVAKAQMIQAIGIQQIEALCDMFCDDITKQYVNTKPRFSPGYGGLSLESQNYIFGLLDCSRQIGVSLNSSLLMSPSKSVSAIIAIPDLCI